MKADHQAIEIVKYSDIYREQLLDVWEKSVLATHGFLSQADFQEIKELLATIDFNAFDVYCLLEAGKLIGFIGTANQKVEMLFLLPERIGIGLGRRLLNFATRVLHANKVDVNEQNKKALEFYSKFGFEAYERTDKDEQGRNYPLIRMVLKTEIPTR